MNFTNEGEIALPLTDGSCTLPEALDFHRRNNPDEPMYVFSSDPAAPGPTKVTFAEFSRACDRVAHAVRPGRAGDDGRVVAMILVADPLVYQAILIGIMKAGLVPFPISHRLTSQAVVNMLMETSCHNLIVTKSSLPGDLLGGIKDELRQYDDTYELRVDEALSIDYIFPKLGKETESDPHDRYPPCPQHPPTDDVVMYLHSSGSTGMPKVVPETHRNFSQWGGFGIPDLRVHKNPRLRYGAMALPPFHALGVFTYTILPLYHGLSIATYPPTFTPSNPLPIVPTPENVIDHLRRTQSSGLSIVPAFLHAWSESEENVKYLGTLTHILFAGGPVSTKVGDALVAAGVNLQSIYGGTEFGPPIKFYTHRGRIKDWEWIEFNDKAKIEWVEQGDGTYECHFMKCDGHYPSILNRSDKSGYATSDLFARHPTNEKLWKIVGRIDDVIIHSSGEKTVPGPMEEIILSSPMIRGAVMFGRGHDHAGVLIEPRANLAIDVGDNEALASLRNRIWPLIEEANKLAPNYSRIFKEMILISNINKPLPRAAKGTVMRKAALRDYDDEIEALYKGVASSAGSEHVEPPSNWELPTVEQWLANQVELISQTSKPPSVTKDLFEQGLDSLSVTFLRLRILSAMRSSNHPTSAINAITQNTAYVYPTIRKLAQHISSITTNTPQVKTLGGRVKSIEAMIEEYSTGLAPVVLLTGSTGHLGSQLLASLLSDETVQRVYAFNRRASSGIEQRHFDRFKSGRLDVELLKSEKLQFVEGDLAEKNMGIDVKRYSELQQSVTLVIHTSWKLDFNLTLESFEPHIRGVRTLIDFARRGPHASTLRFIFTSSIASAQSWDQLQGPYPEQVIRHAKFAVGNGYGESKYVAERILERSGLRACSLRIGQVSGSLAHGAWATTEWFPSLVKSSIALGGFPSAPGLVSWLPLDAVSQSILDLASLRERLPFAINLVHPRPVAWNYVIEAVRDAVVKVTNTDSAQLPLIPFSEWLNRLLAKTHGAKPEDFESVPALKIVDFFREMAKPKPMFGDGKEDDKEFTGGPKLDTKKAQELSVTMQSVSPLRAEDVIHWIKYWKDVGFL